jgi:hypothetical protein
MVAWQRFVDDAALGSGRGWRVSREARRLG